MAQIYCDSGGALRDGSLHYDRAGIRARICRRQSGAGLSVLAVPYFHLDQRAPRLRGPALVWQIAAEIGRDNSFCHKNAERLRLISFLALTDTVLYIASGFYLALANILPISVFLLIVGIVSIGIALTVASAALSHLTQKAADLKSENDLTI